MSKLKNGDVYKDINGSICIMMLPDSDIEDKHACIYWGISDLEADRTPDFHYSMEGRRDSYTPLFNINDVIQGMYSAGVFDDEEV